MTDIADQFARDCHHLRLHLDEEAKIYQEEKTESDADAKLAFAPFLHRPIVMGAFGRTDEVAWMLADSFSVTTRIAALNPAIENCELGFLPKLEGLKSRHQNEILNIVGTLPQKWTAAFGSNPAEAPYWPFYEAHELLNDVDWQNASGSPDWRSARSLPGAIRQTPLCVVTRLKLNVTTTMNHGAVLMHAAERAVIGCAQRVCLAFLDSKNSPPVSRVGPSLAAPDILGMKMLLVEPVGADDIMLITYCSNYAIAASIACALRALTFDVLLDYAEDRGVLESAFHRSEVHKALFDDARKRVGAHEGTPTRTPEMPPWYFMAKNHLFMATSSMFCFAHHATKAPADYHINGFVQAYINVSINPGHEGDIRHKFDNAYPTHVKGEKVEHTYGFVPGQHDEFFNVSTNIDPQGEVISTVEFLRFIDRLFDAMTGINVQDRYRCESGFLDMQTSLVVRVPDFANVIRNRPLRENQTAEDHRREIETIMCEVTEHYPGDPALLPQVIWNQHGHGLGLFYDVHRKVEKYLGLGGERNFLDFREDLRSIGCPHSLQLPLIRLYQDFLGGLRDPLLCDAILTMFEAMVAVKDLLRKDLKEYLQNQYPDQISRRAQQAKLFSSRMFLVDFLESLQQAFRLRFQGELPRGAGHNGAAHFRGGLAKLIASVDVPLLCGMGFFRRVLLAKSGQSKRAVASTLENSYRQRFAAVTAVGVEPRTTARVFRLQKSSRDFPSFFFKVNLDFAYLFRPEQIRHIFHEIGHIVCETFAWKSVESFSDRFFDAKHWQFASSSNNCRPVKEFLHNRSTELFVELLTHLLIFGSDTDLYSRTFAMERGELEDSIFMDINDGLQPIKDKKEIHGRATSELFESLFTAFTVTDLVSSLPKNHVGDPFAWPATHPRFSKKEAARPTRAWSRFERYFEKYGRYFPEFKVLLSSEAAKPARERCRNYFFHRFTDPKLHSCLNWTWNSAVSCLHEFCRIKNQESELENDHIPKSEQEFRSLNRAVRACLIEGRTFCAGEWAIGPLDPFVVLCRLAYYYADLVYGEIDPRKEIYFSDDSGGRQKQKYNRFMVRPSRMPLYCPHPNARRSRTRWQVAFFKSLSNLASQLRARRLLAMIQLPE